MCELCQFLLYLNYSFSYTKTSGQTEILSMYEPEMNNISKKMHFHMNKPTEVGAI